jgi:RND family efflux transporter MFP subunit
MNDRGESRHFSGSIHLLFMFHFTHFSYLDHSPNNLKTYMIARNALFGCGWLAVPLVAILSTLAACNTTSGASNRSGAGGRGGGVSVETTPVQRIAIQRQVDLSGTLMSLDQAKVSSEVAGRVDKVLVELGSEVRQGDVLVQLEPRELTLALERAESALRQVEAQLGIDRTQDKQPPPDEMIASVQQAAANRDDASAGYTRAQQLGGRGLVSQVDKDTAETRMKVMEANYQAAIDNVRSLKASLEDRRAAYDLAQKKLNDATIKAPVAGTIAERLVQPGEYIREDTQIVTLVQMQPLKLRTAVQEKFAGLIKPGQAVQFYVEAFPSRVFDGKVAFVGPAVDQATRTFAIEALVDNTSRELKPGFFAKGVISTRLDENVLAVSDDAVSTLAGVSTVYVIEDGKIRPQIVSLGVHQGKVWEIADGLKGTEMLAASNLNQLSKGTAVRTGHERDAGSGPESPADGGRGRGRAAGGQR